MTDLVVQERGYFCWSTEPAWEGYRPPPPGAYGLLQIDSSGVISLELDGMLPEPTHHPIFRVLRARELIKESVSIAGVLKLTNRQVLLLHLERNGARANARGLSHESYRAEFCLIGRELLAGKTVPPRFSFASSPFHRVRGVVPTQFDQHRIKEENASRHV